MVGNVSWRGVEFQKHELHRAKAHNLQIHRAVRKGSERGWQMESKSPKRLNSWGPLPLGADRGTEGFSTFV